MSKENDPNKWLDEGHRFVGFCAVALISGLWTLVYVSGHPVDGTIAMVSGLTGAMLMAWGLTYTNNRPADFLLPPERRSDRTVDKSGDQG